MHPLQKRVRKNDFFSVALVIAISAIAFALFTIVRMGFYTRYWADDFCNANAYHMYGFWGAQKFEYTYWGGRFAYGFLSILVVSIGQSIVPYFPGILVFLLMIATWSVVNQLLKNQTFQPNWGIKLLLTLLFIFLVLFSIPNIGHDLYWQNGSFIYFLPVIFWLILTALLWHFTTLYNTFNNANKILISILIAFVAWFSSGFNEVAIVIQCTALGTALLWEILTQKQKRISLKFQPVAIAFLATLIGLVIVVMAPGNMVRQANFLPHPGLWELIIKTTLYSTKFTAKWFSSYAVLIWPISIISFTAGLFQRNEGTKRNPTSISVPRIPIGLYISISLLLIIYISFIITTWVYKSDPPGRILIFQTSLLAAFLIFASFQGGIKIRQTFSIILGKQYHLSIFFLILCLYFSFNVILVQSREAGAHLSDAQRFAHEWDKQNAEILSQAASAKKIIYVDMNVENFMGLEHFRSDSTYYVNMCAAIYYDVEKIIAK